MTGAEQEINLRDYIDVIIKRKILILGIFFLSIIFTSAANFATPKTYEISMIIEPGTTGISDSGENMLIDSPSNIKARLESDVFDLKVINALKLDPHKDKVKLKVSQPRDSILLKISINEPEKDRELGVKILNQYFNELSDFNKRIIDAKKGSIDRQIAIISNNIEDKKNAIKINEKNIDALELQEKELMTELKDIKVNVEQLTAKMNTLLSSQLTDFRLKRESIISDIKSLENEIINLNIEAERLKIAKENIYSINLTQEPRISSEPLVPKMKQNIFFTGIVSLVVGIFLSFFLEYLQKEYRKK